MLTTVLVLLFVSAFVALCLYGHVLLVTAIWPNLFGARHKPQFDTVAGPDHELNQPTGM